MHEVKIPFMIDSRVTKLGSSKDYATGRIGTVVELKDDRRRVRWDTSSSGEPMKPIRTWVNVKFLASVAKNSTLVT